jgi:ferritin-like metal-binding protein YciE
MALFTSRAALNTFDELFMEQLQDLYDAEQRITKALPKMAAAAHDSSLKSAFEEHLRQTENQVKRLEKVFQILGKSCASKTCAGVKGIIEEGEEIVSGKGDPDVKDAGLIAAAQKVEHYEISAYGTARTFAQRLGKTEAARLLEETLAEEKETDKKLNVLAERGINPKATAKT